MTLQAIKYSPGKLEILDQLKLPHQEIYLEITSAEDAWNAIKSMQVRGAPAIAIVAILSLAIWGAKYMESSVEQADPPQKILAFLLEALKYLVTSRPTAVNLAEAASRLQTLIQSTSRQAGATGFTVLKSYIKAAEQMLLDDVKDNKNIGNYGAEWIEAKRDDQEQKISVLTHCNTGYREALVAACLFIFDSKITDLWLLQVMVQHSVSSAASTPAKTSPEPIIQKLDHIIKGLA